MTNRFKLRDAYIQAWYELDASALLATTSEDFIFDDPAEPEPITRRMLPEYMLRWDRRARAAGGKNLWILEDQVRQDCDNVLTDWEWWELTGTNLKGMGLVKTGESGVFLERITYFQRNPVNQANLAIATTDTSPS